MDLILKRACINRFYAVLVGWLLLVPAVAGATGDVYMYRSDGRLIAVGDTIGQGSSGDRQRFRVDWTDFYSSSYTQNDTLGFYFLIAGDTPQYIAKANGGSDISISTDVTTATDITSGLGKTSGKGLTENYVLKNYHSDTQFYELTLSFTTTDEAVSKVEMTCQSSASMATSSTTDGGKYYGYATQLARYFLVVWPDGNSTDYSTAQLFPFSCDRERGSGSYYYGERYTLHLQNFWMKQQTSALDGSKYSTADNDFITADTDHQYMRFSIVVAGNNGDINRTYSSTTPRTEYCTWQNQKYVPCIEDLVSPYDIYKDSTDAWTLNADYGGTGKWVNKDSTTLCTNYIFGRVLGKDYGKYGAPSPDSVYYVKLGHYQAYTNTELGKKEPDRYSNSFYIDLDDCGQSMTFTLVPDTAVHMFIEFNESTFGDATWDNGYDPKGYYLIGNFTSEGQDAEIDPYTKEENRKEMTKWYYKNGQCATSLEALSTAVEYTVIDAVPLTDKHNDARDFQLYTWGDTITTETSATAYVDSVVYKANVMRPEGGWGELMCNFVGATDYAAITTSWTGNKEAWAKVIRPQSSWHAAVSDADAVEYGSDCTAMQGGLFKNEDVALQTINPVIYADTSSISFVMNITTSTYRITTNTESDDGDRLYITGPAVNAADYTDNVANTNWGNCSSLPLTAVTDNEGNVKYYTYVVDGKETAIPMTAGKEFVFNYNLDFTYGTYREDDNTPVSLIDYSGTSTESRSYSLNEAQSAADYEGSHHDTQYVNYLSKSYTDTDASFSNNDNLKAMTWNLPTGSYVIRLYTGVASTAADASYTVATTDEDGSTIYDGYDNFYTVNRNYTFNAPYVSNPLKGASDTYYAVKVFSDYNAVTVPDSVGIFYLAATTAPTSSTSTDYTTWQQSTDETNDDYTAYTLTLTEWTEDKTVPAFQPVILGYPLDRSSYLNADSTYNSSQGDASVTCSSSAASPLLKKIVSTMEYSGSPNAANSYNASAQYIPSIAYERAPAAVTESTVEGNTEGRMDTLSFVFGYKVVSATENSAPQIGFFYPSAGGYTAINGAVLRIMRMQLTSSEEEQQSESAPVLVIMGLDEVDTNGQTTDIDNATDVFDSHSDAFYTAAGMRLKGKPTQPGVYIQGGRKVIVR